MDELTCKIATQGHCEDCDHPCQEYFEFMRDTTRDDDGDGFDDDDLTCTHCHGTGQAPDLTECLFCDGEGYKWWV